jgi:hypothetical protein
MAPVTDTYYGNASYKQMIQKNTPKMFEAPPARTGNVLTSNTWTSSAVKQIPDFVAGTAMVPEGSFAIGNAARSAVPMETALKAESNAFRAQLNNRQWEKSMAKMDTSLGRTKGAGNTEPPVAIPIQYHKPFKFTKESYRKPEARTTEIDGYKYDAELSTEQEAVYHNAEEKKVHVSHRGSTTVRDWAESDTQILTGTEDLGGRFAEAENKIIEVRNKYPTHVIEGSGHSLGGSVVHSNTAKFGESPWYGQHTTFNPGTSPFGRGGVQKIIEPHSSIKHAKVTNIRQAMDPISWNARPYGKTITVDTADNPKHAHMLDSFQQDALPSYDVKPARAAAKQIVSGPQGPYINAQRSTTKTTPSTNIYNPRPYYPASDVLPHKGVLPVQPKQYIRHNHDYKISFLQQASRPRQPHTPHITGIRFG